MQSLFQSATSAPRVGRYVAILCGFLAFFVVAVNMREYWWAPHIEISKVQLAKPAHQRPSVFQTAPTLPAWALSLDDDQKFAEAQRRSQSDEALVCFLTLAQKAGVDKLRAESTLFAAEILLHYKSDVAGAEELYRYFLTVFFDQLGADKARYSLGLLDVERGSLPEGIYFLSSVVTETPESDFAGSAALACQRAALSLSLRESRANYGLVNWLHSIMPANPLSLLGFLCYTLLMVVSVVLNHLSNPEHRKSMMTWMLALVFVLLSVFNYMLDKKYRSDTAPRFPETRAVAAM